MLCQKEYELVANKVTSLSMSFLKGTYLMPISVLIALVSVCADPDSIVANVSLIFLPLAITLYGYNHIRYMTLQTKAGEYCSSLEKDLNNYYGEEDVLLWENTLARDSKQQIYETIFFVMFYGTIALLIFILGYVALLKTSYNGVLQTEVAMCIAVLYGIAIMMLLFFLLLFTIGMTSRIYQKIMSNRGEKFLKKSIFRRVVFMLLFVCIILLPNVFLPFVSFYKNETIQQKENIDWKTYDTVIVLGNRLNNGVLSKEGIERMDCLIDCLEEDLNDQVEIILSGGRGEAEAMNCYLNKNVQKKLNVQLESESKTTFQNLKYTKDMVRENVLVITSEYHTFRVHLLMNKCRCNYTIVPARTDNVNKKMVSECYKAVCDFFKVDK